MLLILDNNNMAIDPALLAALQALAVQYKVELKGTVVYPVPPAPPVDTYDVK